MKQSSLGLPEITSPWIFFFFSGPLSTDPSASHLSGDLAQAVASNGRYIWMTLKLSLAELSSELQTNIINGRLDKAELPNSHPLHPPKTLLPSQAFPGNRAAIYPAAHIKIPRVTLSPSSAHVPRGLTVPFSPRVRPSASRRCLLSLYTAYPVPFRDLCCCSSFCLIALPLIFRGPPPAHRISTRMSSTQRGLPRSYPNSGHSPHILISSTERVDN